MDQNTGRAERVLLKIDFTANGSSSPASHHVLCSFLPASGSPELARASQGGVWMVHRGQGRQEPNAFRGFPQNR